MPWEKLRHILRSRVVPWEKLRHILDSRVVPWEKLKFQFSTVTKMKILDLYVIEGNNSSLLGRDWMYKIRMDWRNIFKLEGSEEKGLRELLLEIDEVFGQDLGLLKGEKAKIYMNDNAKPKYFKARLIPYALRQKVETELNRMVETGILEHVQVSEWATPIVPVRKPDNTIRLCGDYKITVNKELDNYPIPNIADGATTMAGCEKFSKLDLELEESSRDLLTLNTHKGLYRPTRLAFGVKSATGIFQRAMENRLKGLPNTIVRVDDILAGGEIMNTN